jgi:glutamate/tyrosine decarboxylase-like PLP-dependent enzyme
MDLGKLATGRLRKVPPSLIEPMFRVAERIPAIRRRLDREYDETIAGLKPAEPPGREPLTRLPATGLSPDQILAILAGEAAAERSGWEEGFASGAVYHGGAEHIDLVDRAYAIHSQANPLHADLWPATIRYEAEVVAMTAELLGARRTGDEVVGTVTSGGTESIILAMKAYRDRSGRKDCAIVAPTTAHVGFDKAAHLLGMRLVKVPVDRDYRADVKAMTSAVDRRTVVVVGSAPGFPHGVLDPIAELSEMARARHLGFHADACLGGFVLPFAAELGRHIPAFDFSLPGVTSMSADPHKYGYAPKGTSVVLYRGRELRRHQYFTAGDWPGGLYYSPTLSGSRPGGLSAAAWAAMASMGKEGYLDATTRILEAADRIKEGIGAIEGLEILGDPLWVIAFTAGDVDVFRLLEAMTRRGWRLNGLHHPPAIHLAVTLRHATAGVVDRFLADLRVALDEVRHVPAGEAASLPVYGMAATFPVRGVVNDLLERYVDTLYEA